MPAGVIINTLAVVTGGILGTFAGKYMNDTFKMKIHSELNELQKEITRQRILETGFHEFADKTIEKVTMTDVANAAGIGVATVY